MMFFPFQILCSVHRHIEPGTYEEAWEFYRSICWGSAGSTCTCMTKMNKICNGLKKTFGTQISKKIYITETSCQFHYINVSASLLTI